tara:strand:+ start:137 stop:529 length:393 start_codon:yes stop_codon:yes gene_type:complete
MKVILRSTESKVINIPSEIWKEAGWDFGEEVDIVVREMEGSDGHTWNGIVIEREKDWTKGWRNKMSKKEIVHPRVKPFKVDDVHVFIKCPYCKETHTHGVSGGDYEGYRSPHCYPPKSSPDYYIEKKQED